MLTLVGWFLAVIIVVLLVGIITISNSMYDWKLWPAIRRAREEVRKVARQRIPNPEVISKQGATRISPGYLSFCIKTQTDRERDVLVQDPQLITDFRNALAKAGYPVQTNPVVHLGVQSQETVDRDYGGSWWEAGQYP